MDKPNIDVLIGGPNNKHSYTYKEVILKENFPLSQQMVEKNRKYVVKWNFDLNGETVTVPEDCLLEFDGGSISNGTIVGNNTVLIYHQELEDAIKDIQLSGTFIYRSGDSIPDDTTIEIKNNKLQVKNGGIHGTHFNADVVDDEDIHLTADNKLQFKDRPNTDGMGRVILRKNKTFAEQVTQENTIYEIRYDFDLDGGEVTMPENCVLKFDSGILSNGTLVGNNTVIRAGLVKIFNTDVTLAGTWNVAEAYPEWFGAKGDGITDDTVCLQKTILAFSSIILSTTYLVSSKINISSRTEILSNKKASIRYIGTTTLFEVTASNCLFKDFIIHVAESNFDSSLIKYIGNVILEKVINLEIMFAAVNNNNCAIHLFSDREINGIAWCTFERVYVTNAAIGFLFEAVNATGQSTAFINNNKILNCAVDSSNCAFKGITNGSGAQIQCNVIDIDYQYNSSVAKDKKVIDISDSTGLLKFNKIKGNKWDLPYSTATTKNQGLLGFNYITDTYTFASTGPTMAVPIAVMNENSWLTLSMFWNKNHLKASFIVEDNTIKISNIWATDINTKYFDFYYSKNENTNLYVLYVRIVNSATNRFAFNYDGYYNVCKPLDESPQYDISTLTQISYNLRTPALYPTISLKGNNKIDASFFGSLSEIVGNDVATGIRIGFGFSQTLGIPTSSNLIGIVIADTTGKMYSATNNAGSNLLFIASNGTVWIGVYNGSTWGWSEVSNTPKSGTFANKPNTSNAGYAYFCTDKQTAEGAADGIMIYHKGSDIWVDALGRVVS